MIFEKHIQTKKYTIIKNSEKEKNFLTKLIKSIKRLNTEHISSKEILKQIVQDFAYDMDRIWFKNLKIVNTTEHLKLW